MSRPLCPLVFEPVYKNYIWGGDWIIRKYGRSAPPGVYAESWEVSDREDGMSVVRGGPMAGVSLCDAIGEWGVGLLGSRAGGLRFPLLIKLIDSRERLSVQVHPDDASAARHGGEAKTEMWYVLDAAPGAGVFAGLKPGVDASAFRRAMEEKRFREILTRVPVKAGDAIFIPGGLVHAIDAGCLLLEVQQNSNTTYRIYDWDRVGPDGQPRPLHIAEAMKVIRWDLGDAARVAPKDLPAAGGNARALVVESPYFRVEKFALSRPQDVSGDGGSFQVLFVISGAARIAWDGLSEALPAGTSCLVPASLRGVKLESAAPGAEMARITLP